MLKYLLYCISTCSLSSFNSHIGMHRMRIQMQASKDHDHEFEQLSTAVAGRGLNSTRMECVKEGILAPGGLEQPKIEKVESPTENAPSQTLLYEITNEHEHATLDTSDHCKTKAMPSRCLE
ncbi:hypothetical protein WR25_01566 [Diploscapter pachys]|uniref:Uncharacterized protein n=1 Tax=Diploscapter pachys TaxID=2018661 RepID=A0A2A2K5F1_9BILA|nr:hypothetical protein WR25_01566 [Diploscapter pachys]